MIKSYILEEHNIKTKQEVPSTGRESTGCGVCRGQLTDTAADRELHQLGSLPFPMICEGTER